MIAQLVGFALALQAPAHARNATILHDPAGADVDIVSEDFGACPGPGPTTVMRLRNASADRAVEAVVARSVNVAGKVTVTQERLTVPAKSALTLGCAAQPNPAGGRPLSVTEWKILASRYR